MLPLAGALNKLDHVWTRGARLVGFLQMCSSAVGSPGNSAGPGQPCGQRPMMESLEFGWHPVAATSLWLVEELVALWELVLG